MDILGARPTWSMSDSEKLSTLDAVVAEQNRLETLRLRLIADIDHSGYAKDLGAGDTARLLSARYRQDLAHARCDVRTANRLTKFASTSAALPDPAIPFGATTDDADNSGTSTVPELNPAQAATILDVLDRMPTTVPRDDLAVAERELIGLAATHTPSELRRAGRVIKDILDPDGPEPDEKAAYDRESLTLKPAGRGVTFQGYLANENAELLRTLIHAHARPHKTADGQLDPRPHSKRQADALTTILNAATSPSTRPANALPGTTSGTVPSTDPDNGPDAGPGVESDSGSGAAAARDAVPGHGSRPHISITIDFDALSEASANATGAMIFGDNLSAATVRRLACDAEVLPIVLGSKSQPLDVGTSQRLVTRPMRRALNARDKGCVVCGAPPIHCEAHHLISWIDGGITAVSNLALLCKRHHLDLHSGHWQIRILDGVVHVTRPAWMTPTCTPPNTYRPPAPPPGAPCPPQPAPLFRGRPATPSRDTTGTNTPARAESHQPPRSIWGDEDPPPRSTPEGAPTRADVWGDDAPPNAPTRRDDAGALGTTLDVWGEDAPPAVRGTTDPLGTPPHPADIWGDEPHQPRTTPNAEPSRATNVWGDESLPRTTPDAAPSRATNVWDDEDPPPTLPIAAPPLGPWGDDESDAPAVGLPGSTNISPPFDPWNDTTADAS